MGMYDNEPTMMGQGRPSASLVIRQGPQAGMSFPLSGNQVLLGREEGLDVSLQDPEASRRHARVSWQGGQYVIEDLGSTNGTFVNGVQITAPQPLNPGDSVGIGQTTLVFQMAGAPVGVSQQQYQSSPAYYDSASAAAVPAAQSDSTNQVLQYTLYGCGCLLLLCICALLMVVAVALLDPTLFEDITGINISMQTVESFLTGV